MAGPPRRPRVMERRKTVEPPGPRPAMERRRATRPARREARVPDLLFDGRSISVPPATNLVEAGLAAGVPVPVFCYQRDLGAVGACRVCAVNATLKGRTRMVMACMTHAEDGMEVTTLDSDSIAFRKRVIELLMINHPHDCPICDEGGECQLQDLTIAAGHA